MPRLSLRKTVGFRQPNRGSLKPLRSSVHAEGDAVMVGSVIKYAFIMMTMVARAATGVTDERK